MMKRVVYFIVKKYFRSWDFYIFVLNFWYIENRLDKKVKFSFQIYDIADWANK